jgi:hypothetical protein
MPHGTWQGSGTWKSGGPDSSDVIQIAALVAVVVTVVMIVMAYAWLIISIGAVAVAGRLYILYRKNVTLAAIAARGVLMREEQRVQEAARLAGQRAHELEVARASATVIQNIIDPAALLAAALRQSGPQAVPVTVRAEVER